MEKCTHVNRPVPGGNGRTKELTIAGPIIVGIDPAKESFMAGRWQPSTHRPVGKPKAFANEPSGYEALTRWLAAEERMAAEEDHPAGNVLIAIEHTGSCSEGLAVWLHGRGYDVCMVDPYAVWKASGGEAKTDAIDSMRVAEYAGRHWDRLRPYAPPAEAVAQVRALLTLRERLVEHKTALKNMRGEFGARSRTCPAALAAVEETIAFLKAQTERLEEEMQQVIAENAQLAAHVEHLRSAPGVGLLLAATFLVITEGFTQRRGARTLAAYLGMAPHPHESGTSVRRPGRSRRYGPPIARRLLHLMARSLRTHNARYKAYFLRKKAEGKATRLILNNIANKHLRVLCALIQKGQPYIDGYQSVNPRLLQR
jgi:transposase